MASQSYFYGTGRRKTSVARVRLTSGSGAIIINGTPFEQRFPCADHQTTILEPLRITNMLDRFSAMIKVTGGGVSGQAGAIRHGIARALSETDKELRPLLRQHKLLTRDPRAKERKKYGLKRARKAPQYTKR